MVYSFKKGDSIRTKTIEQLKKADPRGECSIDENGELYFYPSYNSRFANTMNRYMINTEVVFTKDVAIDTTDYNFIINEFIDRNKWSWYIWMLDFSSTNIQNGMEIE